MVLGIKGGRKKLNIKGAVPDWGQAQKLKGEENYCKIYQTIQPNYVKLAVFVIIIHNFALFILLSSMFNL